MSLNTIKRIRGLTHLIQTNPSSPHIAIEVQTIAEDVTNPYLLCLPTLFAVAQTHNIDVSSISSTVERIKNEYKRR